MLLLLLSGGVGAWMLHAEAVESRQVVKKMMVVIDIGVVRGNIAVVVVVVDEMK